jgi:hypothetical protein
MTSDQWDSGFIYKGVFFKRVDMVEMPLYKQYLKNLRKFYLLLQTIAVSPIFKEGINYHTTAPIASLVDVQFMGVWACPVVFGIDDHLKKIDPSDQKDIKLNPKKYEKNRPLESVLQNSIKQTINSKLESLLSQSCDSFKNDTESYISNIRCNVCVGISELKPEITDRIIIPYNI